MAVTYEPIATQTLGSSASSVSFNSISGTFTDLILVVQATGSQTQLRLRFNGDSGSNYSVILMYGDGTSYGAVQVQNDTSANVGGIVGEVGLNYININGYSNSTTFKTALSRYGFMGTYTELGSKMCLWRNTNAITSILCFPTTGNFDANSTFTLYGIKAA